LVRRTAPKERLQELPHDNWVDRLPLVRDRQLKALFTDKLIRGAVLQRVCHKIRRDLSDTLRVTIDRVV
jgi:hypothetical protein